MSDHYFSSEPSSSSERHSFRVVLRNQEFVFITENGVFSKRGIDFGTRLLLERVEVDEGEEVLDMGCSYGAVGITLAKCIENIKVCMVEVNERAYRLACENARINEVTHKVRVVQGDGFGPVSGTFSKILLNPPIRAGKKVVYKLFRDARSFLSDVGSLWVVIRKQQGALSAQRELENYYESVEVLTRKSGYWIICASIVKTSD